MGGDGRGADGEGRGWGRREGIGRQWMGRGCFASFFARIEYNIWLAARKSRFPPTGGVLSDQTSRSGWQPAREDDFQSRPAIWPPWRALPGHHPVDAWPAQGAPHVVLPLPAPVAVTSRPGSLARHGPCPGPRLVGNQNMRASAGNQNLRMSKTWH